MGRGGEGSSSLPPPHLLLQGSTSGVVLICGVALQLAASVILMEQRCSESSGFCITCTLCKGDVDTSSEGEQL